MRIGYFGEIDSIQVRIWIQDMSARGAEAAVFSERCSVSDAKWAPLRQQTPPIPHLGLARLYFERAVAARLAAPVPDDTVIDARLAPS